MEAALFASSALISRIPEKSTPDLSKNVRKSSRSTWAFLVCALRKNSPPINPRMPATRLAAPIITRLEKFIVTPSNCPRRKLAVKWNRQKSCCQTAWYDYQSQLSAFVNNVLLCCPVCGGVQEVRNTRQKKQFTPARRRRRFWLVLLVK